jgi:hypothetical protein
MASRNKLNIEFLEKVALVSNIVKSVAVAGYSFLKFEVTVFGK